MTGSKYGSINNNDTEAEGEVEARLAGEERLQEREGGARGQVVGVSLALVSGALFTANNFLINQFRVSVPDLLLVRTLMQMLIYTGICLYRSPHSSHLTSKVKCP